MGATGLGQCMAGEEGLGGGGGRGGAAAKRGGAEPARERPGGDPEAVGEGAAGRGGEGGSREG